MLSFKSPFGGARRSRTVQAGRDGQSRVRLSGSWRRRVALPVVIGMFGAALPVALSTSSAVADTRPPAGVPATASAKALPTWQINGVGWAQVVVGNTVYVTGNFTTARPPGVGIGGAGQVNVGHLLAYDITTGNRIASFNHILNAQGRGIAASPDGSRVYVVGDFTTVDGAARGHVAAFDTVSGALVTNLAPNVNGAVRAVTATNTAVYFGGSFSNVNGTARGSLASVNTSDGSLRSWAPGVDATVWSMVLTPDLSKVVIGGQFVNLNATVVNGHGAVSASTGGILPWLANQYVHDATNGAVGSLTTDGTYIYGTGWAFGAGSSFEGTYAANPADGSIHWIYDCLGDTYSAAAAGDAIYSVGHSHDCTMIDEFPDTNPRVRWQNSLAFTKDARGTNRGPDVYGWNYNGLPAPKLLHWFPQWSNGSFTGQYQAGWSVTGNSQYVAVAGEFPYVNGGAQQGLVRFGIGTTANNTSGPTYETKPPRDVPSTTAGSVRPGTVRVGFGSAWDYDNETLTYQVVRDGNTNVGAPITQKSNFWTLPSLSITDTNVPAGNHTYRVRITDPFGNLLLSPVSNQVAVSNTIGAYGDAVIADDPVDYWRFGEAGGNLALDGGSAGLDQSTKAGVTWGASGAVSGNTAARFDGTSTGQAGTSTLISGPDSFATEAWINTTTASGGKILGFGNSNQGGSGSYDRHVYMTSAGKLVFGIYDGGTRTITTADSFNDGQWHHIVASMGSEGMRLYVDGLLQGKQPSVTAGQPYQGYWLVGGDSLGGWPDQPSSNFFAGAIDEVAVYGAPLTEAKVRAHYTASGRTVNVPPAPSDSYGSAVYGSTPDFYWRLNEATGSVARDEMGSTNGNLTGGFTLGVAGAVPGQAGDKSVGLDGVNGNVTAATTVTNPTTYSEELWFNTTTTRGGKLIGMGDQPTGNSGGYDRHVWMLNDGRLRFGTWTGQPNTIDSSRPYNDGGWHHMVATQGAAGMKLIVDGVLVGTNPQTQAQDYTGYWRVGGDTHWGDADSQWFNGRIDEVAIYSRALPLAEVQAHYSANGGTVVNTPPVASFTASTVGRDLTVDGSGSSDPDGSIASYVWNFGDGATGSGETAAHTYAASGTYTVTLTVTDNRGAAVATTRSVVTVAPPTDAYGAAVYATNPDLYWRLGESGGVDAADAMGRNGGTYFGGGVSYGGVGAVPGTNTSVGFDGNVSGVGSTSAVDNPTTYTEELWFKTTTTSGGKLIGFGDRQNGFSSNYDRHVYMTASGQLNFGVYTGALNVVTSPRSYNNGQWHHIAAMQGSDGMKLYVDGALVGTDPQTAAQPYSGYWRVGGDSSWADSNFFAGQIDEVAVYSKTLSSAQVQNHFVKGGGVVANDPPVASFTATLTGRTVAVDASASTDPDGNIATYEWDFGDGATDTGVTAAHPYTAAGPHTVTLKVTDDKGGSNTTTRAVNIANQDPTASFTSTSNRFTATVNGSASTDPDGNIASYAWTFGDGGTASTATANHTYAAAGAFSVKLVVTDNDGATAEVTHTVTVSGNAAPVASFTTGTNGLVVTVNGSASTDPDGTIATYAWIFGDGGTATTPTPTANHTYAAGGTYTITLTVTDNDGTSTSTTRSVAVVANQSPTAAFTQTANDLVLALDGSGSSDPDGTIAAYAWTFGDGDTASVVKPSHTYAAPGTYTVALKVTDNVGAVDTVTKSVVVTGPFAKDTFARTLATGLGSAQTGGAWTLSGVASAFSVANGWGNMRVATAGKGLAASLAGVSSTDTDLSMRFTFDTAPTGGGHYGYFTARGSFNDAYRTKVFVAANGAMTVALTKVVAGAETTFASQTLTGVTFVPGTSYSVRMQAWGTSPTRLTAKVWRSSDTEPTAWTVSATDATASLQVAGGIVATCYESGTATNAPVTFRIADLVARKTGN
ncbi:PKD domain-containing protein [Terrabacter sp. Ter38]|uniref:PKD domain-containing protein n=1 Tax=Terrabacter sp. Ter38 TaxID=2926030 RepID=UPI002118A350|nr:PKD domain-containing protein [Terrabacter sp. Ter38]